MAEAPTKKTWDGLILGLFILAAVVVIGAFAYLFPHILGRYCGTNYLPEKQASYTFTISGQSKIDYAAPDKKQARPAPPVPQGSQENAQGTASPNNQLGYNPTGWRIRFWCDVNGSDYFIALFTLVLAVATGFLWLSTHRLWKSGERQIGAAVIAAKAATKSANAVIEAERARFHVVIQGHNLGQFIKAATLYENSPDMPMRGEESSICYRHKNYGKGPGLIQEFSHGLVLSEQPPDTLVYTVVRQAPAEYMVPNTGVTEFQYCRATLPIASLQDAIDIRGGRKHIWFYGRFDYVDFVTNSPQVHRFLMRYIQTEGEGWRFQSYDHKHYNQST